MAKESAIRNEVEFTPEVVPLDPRDDSHYYRFRDLNLEEVAWEFLRRDENFRKECDEAADDAGAGQEVATKWKLFRFKHYALEFKEVKRPRFLPTLVRYFPNLTNQPLPRQITLLPGHAAFVLNAGALLKYQQAEEAQVKRLLRRLKRYLRDLSALAPLKPKQLQLKEENFAECLQLLDLRNAKVTVSEIKALLPSIKLANQDDGARKIEATKRYYKLRLQAQKLAYEGYLELAVVGAARRAEMKALAKADKRQKDAAAEVK